MTPERNVQKSLKETIIILPHSDISAQHLWILAVLGGHIIKLMVTTYFPILYDIIYQPWL